MALRSGDILVYDNQLDNRGMIRPSYESGRVASRLETSGLRWTGFEEI